MACTLMARSFKYHRPRGVVTAGASEPNALMEIGEGGHTRATMVELRDAVATSQNRWPSRGASIGVNGLAAAIFVAGFYDSSMWPKSFWEKVTSRYHPLPPRCRPWPSEP